MRYRVLLAGFYHETHTFVDDRSGLDMFDRRVDGELLASRGDDSPMSGVIAAADAFGWELVPTVDYRGGASGLVEDEVFEEYWQLLRPRLQRALHDGIDAIFLVLHGAMTTQSHFDGEGALLARIRALPGATVPIFGVYDLHANFTERMAKHANCLVAYRNNPHTDARDSAVRAAELLQRSLADGQVPRMDVTHPAIVWPPTGTGTADDPMMALEAMARELEDSTDAIWAVNVNAGFSFADVPEAGVSFSVAGLDDATAKNALRRLSTKAEDMKELGNVVDTPIDEVLRGIAPNPKGPIVLVEPADNIGGGAPGDGTGLLRAFLRHGVENAGVIIADPAAVRELRGLRPGDRAELSIGGKGSRLDPGPVTLSVELISSSGGQFELEDPNSHLAAMRGRHIDMGPSAVVRHESITILLTSRKTPPFDLGQWRSQGVEPQDLSFIGVKAAVAHRRAYDRIAAESHTVGTDGPCASDLRKLPFRNIVRPVYPLDDSSSANSDGETSDG